MTDKIDISKDSSTYDNQFEIFSMLPKVKSSIKKNITQDYTLADLNKDEREFITENYSNAEYAKEILSRLATKGYRYEWDDKKGDWVRNTDGSFKRVLIQDTERKLIMTMGGRIFEFFMIQPHLIAILNRNKDTNFIVKLLGKNKDDEKPVMYGEDDRNMLQKVVDKFRGEEVAE